MLARMLARKLHGPFDMAPTNVDETLRDTAVRYAGFALIAWTVVLGELLVRADELLFLRGASSVQRNRL